MTYKKSNRKYEKIKKNKKCLINDEFILDNDRNV